MEPWPPDRLTAAYIGYEYVVGTRHDALWLIFQRSQRLSIKAPITCTPHDRPTHGQANAPCTLPMRISSLSDYVTVAISQTARTSAYDNAEESSNLELRFIDRPG